MASKAHIELMAQEICSEDRPVHGCHREASVKLVGCVGSRREGEREPAWSPTRNGLTTGSAKRISGRLRQMMRKDTDCRARVDEEQPLRQSVADVKEALRGPT